jgi:UDP-3-O-[3-hydroxymyristoyl] glucosamine N-acyltransferase
MIFRRKYTRIKQWNYLPDGRKVQRIQAVRSFGTIKQGTIGGFIEEDENLSHYGNCWIADNAIAAGESRVRQNALLKNRARIDDRVLVSDSSTIQEEAVLRDDVFVYGNAVVGFKSFLAGTATVCGHAIVFCRPRYRNNGKSKTANFCDFVMVKDFARLEGSISLRDHCVVGGNTIIRNNAQIMEHARIEDDAIVESFAVIGDKALICQSSRIGGRTKIMGQCIVQGHSVILGKSLLLCNVRVGGYSVIKNEHLSGDEVRWEQFSHKNNSSHACITSLPTRSG